MTKKLSLDSGNIQRADSESMQAAQAERKGADYRWHHGRLTRLGVYGGELNNRTVTVLWEEGGLSCQYGDITDEQWDVLKLSFMSTGMITVLSDQVEDKWMYDLRFLEAVR